jgi:hypothetical protein
VIREEWGALLALEKGFGAAGWEEADARNEALQVALAHDLTDATTDDLVEIVTVRTQERQMRRKASSGMYSAF